MAAAEAASGGERRPPIRLWEIAVAANAVAVLAVVRWGAGIQLGFLARLGDTVELVEAIAVALAAGIAVRLFVAAVRGGARGAREAARALLGPWSLWEVARFLVFSALLSWGYTWLKLVIPLVHPKLMDEALMRIDTAVHFGLNPSRLAIELFPFPALWRLLDAWYDLFLMTLLVAIGWFGSTPSSSERARFAGGFALVWIAGAWWYLATPSLGPCYAFPADYASVRPAMPSQTRIQALLLSNYAAVRSFPAHPGEALISPYLGIAAMPSLHVAVQAFVALFARRRSRAIALLYAAAAAATLFASIVSGWHYAIDGYAGILLALVAWWVGEKVVAGAETGRAPASLTTNGRERSASPPASSRGAE